MKGYAEKDISEQLASLPPDRYELIGDTKIRRRDIPGYFNDEFWECIKIWKNCTTLGLPWSGGWATQPAHIARIIMVCDAEYNAVQRERMQRERK